MGTYQQIEKDLPEKFSFFLVAALLGIEDGDKESLKALRNTMTQFCNQGFIERTSHNMYQKKHSKK
jgi:hypothetical protein